MNQASFFTDEDLRNKFLDKADEILDGFGEIETFLNTNHSSAKMIAKFYKCPYESVALIIKSTVGSKLNLKNNTINLSREEVEDSGYKIKSKGSIVCDILDSDDELLYENIGITADKTAPMNVSFYDRQGVLKIGMLLKDSMIAVNIRKKMLMMLEKEMED